MIRPMRCWMPCRTPGPLFSGVLILGFLLTAEGTAESSDWVFRRSYYSHENSPGYQGGPVPEERSAHRPAMTGAHPRFAIRGGYRYNNFVLWNGNSYDRVIYRENWFDAGY